MDFRTVKLPNELHFPHPLQPDLMVGLLGSHPPAQLAAYSLDGKSIWSQPLQRAYQIAAVTHQQCWLMGRRDLIAFAADGSRAHEFDLQLAAHERIGAVESSGPALFLSIYRTKRDKKFGFSTRVVRASLDGEIQWSTTLPIDKIAYKGCQYMGVETNWQARPSPAWNPESWLPCGSDQLLLSGNRLLASVQEMPRSGIGCRYVLDADNGQLIWKSQATPIANALALGGGRFLIGNQGYGALETYRYEDNIEALPKWNSHGEYVLLSDGRIVCVEMSNDLSVPQYVVGFKDGGKVKQLSPRLDGYYTSQPIVFSDDSLYFWRADQLWNWSEQSGLRSLRKIGFGDGSYASSLRFSSHRFAIDIRGPYREDGASHLFALFECP